MKQLLLVSVFMLFSIAMFAQAPVGTIRVATAGTAIGVNISRGTFVYNMEKKELWVANAATASTVKLDDGGFTQINSILMPTTAVDHLVLQLSSTDNRNTLSLPAAVASVAPGSGTAGLITGDDQKKLNSISDTPVGSYTVESFVAADAAVSVTLAQTPKVGATAAMQVAVNGTILKAGVYSNVAKVVTVGVPLLANDVVTVSYIY